MESLRKIIFGEISTLINVIIIDMNEINEINK